MIGRIAKVQSYPRNVEGNLILQRHRSGPCTQRCVPRTRPVKIPAPALTKQAHRTPVSPGPQLPLRGLAYGFGALGAQPGRSTEPLLSATTVDYSHYETLGSPETHPRRHRTSVSPGAAAGVLLGAVTPAPRWAIGGRSDVCLDSPGLVAWNSSGSKRQVAEAASGAPSAWAVLVTDAILRRDSGRCCGLRGR